MNKDNNFPNKGIRKKEYICYTYVDCTDSFEIVDVRYHSVELFDFEDVFHEFFRKLLANRK